MLRIDGIQDKNCQAIYIIGKEPLVAGEDVHSRVSGDSRLFVKKTNIEGIFTYGAEQQCDSCFGGRKGHIWSSRASVMNHKFGCALVECNYKVEGDVLYTTCAIDLAHLEHLLEETDYTIDWNPHVENIDTHYKLIKKSTN